MIDKKRIEKAIKEIIIALGDDPNREGLIDTPTRVSNMYEEMFEGMNYTNDELVDLFDKTFDCDYHTDSKNLVYLKGIEVFSFCEHHMALMYDMTVDIAYIPNKRVIGLSKLARICDMVSKRLQLQERITEDILYIVKRITKSEDVYVLVRGCHSCISARGIKKKAFTTTKSACGKFKNQEVII